MHEAMLQRGLESPYAERLAEWEPDLEHDKRITTRVPCAEYFPVRDRALIAHATQIDPEGAWFAVPLDVHQEAWPTEDYELVHSLVESTMPEDDLFAGVTGPGVDVRRPARDDAGMIPAADPLAYDPNDVKPGWIALLIVLPLGCRDLPAVAQHEHSARQDPGPQEGRSRTTDDDVTDSGPMAEQNRARATKMGSRRRARRPDG